MIQILNAVQQGCAAVKQAYQRKDHLNGHASITEKDNPGRLKDLQTHTDIETERLIKESLSASCLATQFFGEEGSEGSIDDIDSDYFILDPIDGTSNFVALRDYFAISLAYVEEGVPRIGVIADPIRNIIVAAENQQGCYQIDAADLNKKIRLSPVEKDKLENIQIDFEFSFLSEKERDVMMHLTAHSMGMRKHGSSAMDIANMVLGRRSAMIANQQKPYDIAAGLVIAAEAGLVASDWTGKGATLTTSCIVVANALAHERIIHLLKNVS